MTKSIQSKLGYSMIIALIIALVILSVIGNFFTLKLLDKRLYTYELPNLMTSLRNDIDRRMNLPITIALQVAQNHYVQDWATRNTPEDEVQKWYDYGKTIRQNNPTITDVFFVSEQNKKYFTEDTVLTMVDPNKDKDKWYFNFIATQKEFELNLDMNEKNNTLTMFINCLVHAPDRRLLGVAGVGVKMNLLLDILKKSLEKSLISGGTAYLIDHDGKVRVHGEVEKINRVNIHEVEGMREVASSIMDKKDFAVAQYSAKDDTILVVSSYLENFDWYLVVEIPTNAVYAEANFNTLKLVLVSVIVTVIFSFVIIRLSRSISQPIKVLHQKVLDVAKGKPFEPFQVNTQDEIEQLATSFNLLMLNQQHIIQDINRVMQAVVNNDFSQRVEVETQGDLNLLKNNINEAVSRLQETTEAVLDMMRAMDQGDFKKRLTRNVQTEFVQTINHVMENMDMVFADINTVMSAVASGELDKTMTIDAKGDLKQLKENTNASIITLKSIILRLNAVLNVVAAGDLREEMHEHYDGIFGSLTKNVNTTIDSLRQLVSKISEGAMFIQYVCQKIVEGNNDLAQRSAEQAKKLAYSTQSMLDLSEVITQNSTDIKNATQLVIQSSAIAEQGGAVVNNVVRTMQDMSGSAERIGEITSVIDTLAFQTNILAINASIEAARAGEHGRGFSVVANEVRNLAQRSALSAKDIKTLVSTSVLNIENGSRLAMNAGETMTQVVGSVKNFTQIMTAISGTTEKQNAGIEKTHCAVKEASQMTQQNLTLADELTYKTNSLQEKAAELIHSIQAFIIR